MTFSLVFVDFSTQCPCRHWRGVPQARLGRELRRNQAKTSNSGGCKGWSYMGKGIQVEKKELFGTTSDRGAVEGWSPEGRVFGGRAGKTIPAAMLCGGVPTCLWRRAKNNPVPQASSHPFGLHGNLMTVWSGSFFIMSLMNYFYSYYLVHSSLAQEWIDCLWGKKSKKIDDSAVPKSPAKEWGAWGGNSSAGDMGSYGWEQGVRNEEFYAGVILATHNKHSAIIKC